MLKRKTSICVILLMALLALGRVQPVFADGCGQAAPAAVGCLMGDAAPLAACCAAAMHGGWGASTVADGAGAAHTGHANDAPAPAGHACAAQLCLQLSASILPQTLTVATPPPAAERLAVSGVSVLPSRLGANLFRPPRLTTSRG
jgi:hypothetical protein